MSERAKLLSLGTDLLRHPLAQRYALNAKASNDNRIYTADNVLGERLARIGALLVIEHTEPGSIIFGRGSNQTRSAALLDFARFALTATPYLWTEEVRTAVRTLELPRHVLSPGLLPAPRSWHTFETGIHLGGTLDWQGTRYIDGTADALLVVDAGIGFNVYCLGEMSDAETGALRVCVTSAGFRYGTTFPDGLQGDLLNVATSPLVMFSFLASPYIPKRQERASRAARREAVRLGAPLDAGSLVTFVVLRRPAARSHSDGEGESVEWRHRWLVSGHVRAQWYPSEQAHRLIWIAPYLKGPEDAPMLDHAFKVAR